MGGNYSSNVNDVATGIISNSLVKNATTCTSNPSQNINFDVSKIAAKGAVKIHDITQNVAQTVNFSCMANNGLNSTTQNAIQQDLLNEIQQKSSGLALSADVSSAINTLKTNIQTNLNVQNTATCVATNSQNVDSIYSDITSTESSIDIYNINQLVVQDLVAKCQLTNTSVSKSLTDLQTAIKNDSSQVNVGVDPISSILGAYTTIVVAVIICCGLCCCVSVIASVFMASSSKPSAALGASSGKGLMDGLGNYLPNQLSSYLPNQLANYLPKI